MAQFLIDNETIKLVQSLIEKKADKRLISKLGDVHYADIAEVIENLSVEEAVYLIKLLDSEKTAEALAEVDEDFREKILPQFSAKEIAEEIEELDTDDAADIIAELPEERQEKVMSEISDSEHLKDIRELLTYEENTAGALMAKELVKVNENLSVLKCLNEMRAQAEEVTRVHSIYVVNGKNKLIGRLSLKDLLTANSKAIVKDIYIPKVDFVNVYEDVEEVAKIMSKYDLEAIPVVNDKKELLGRITIDDIVDVIKEEADKDYQLASGISNDVEADDSILELSRARLPWLFLGLLGGLGSVFILRDFETIMMKPHLRSLFFYTPLIAAMAGNVGVQSSAIIVQGIANDAVKGSLLNRLLKEVGLSLINGFFLAVLLIGFGWIINQDLILSLTVAGSMMGVIIVAALIGTFVPIILNKRGIDPAIATGPFITTANDIFGIYLFFYIAQTFLNF
ncbi:magnesium transporter [Flavobacteriaceae bacterium]|jgi:magnesium transporter|uniref:magnesium transporter n=1 Tax=Candidatus Arcticimaribacter forsetii TaxID=2820661 RepID=UPI00207731F0|nr:magnesium transporter [Candidatus Arcticimaribacter forsetii]MDA8639748.1 magnesium transporter [Flavobacteriaceae bacterium]MDB2325634.1 magnesium transporter [Flavobacteriaceae bacterium]MDB2329707.1 magnesium transporter [Flavobacteriaceae bacterium]MDB2457284.1 magnesium transporter [Flavobacteriaceae bacterium]MDB4675130.1 magnesium transporter [Flavobacteriaceae bacterium]